MKSRETSRPSSIARLGIGHVGLRVANVEKSIRFYRNILGLDGRARGRGVGYVPSGKDLLVLHDKKHGTSDFHFGFLVDTPAKVNDWRAWLRSRKIAIKQDTTEDKYRSIKIRDPDGYWIEITYDGRKINPRPRSSGKRRVG